MDADWARSLSAPAPTTETEERAMTTTIVTAGDARRRRSRRVEPIYYLFLLPSLVLFTLAITVPGVMGIFFSFTDSIGIGDWNFNGLTNYIAAFSDPAILQSYLFTFGFSIATVIVVNVLAFLLGSGSLAHPVQDGLRTIFVIPMVISGIIIAYVFNFLFSNSLPALGVARDPVLSTSLLANPDLAWVAIVIVTAWQAIPGTLLIYIAGLLSVPGDVYEAAAIDGASKTQQLVRITVPLVRVRRDQHDPRVQGLPERLRHHRRPHQRRPRHGDPQRRDDDHRGLQRRRLRLPDGQRDHLLRRRHPHLPAPAVADARKERL
jgi:raffinose/stachyose/melibiose transport system permease protein